MKKRMKGKRKARPPKAPARRRPADAGARQAPEVRRVLGQGEDEQILENVFERDRED
ncbi:MAG TPA: hypothetical protein VFR02_04435 [bacterium]|nr:hypothetical protein [bacterium]